MRRRDKYRAMPTAELLDLLKGDGDKHADLFEEVRLRLKQHAHSPKPELTPKEQLASMQQRIEELEEMYRASTDTRERGGYGRALSCWRAKRDELLDNSAI